MADSVYPHHPQTLLLLKAVMRINGSASKITDHAQLLWFLKCVTNGAPGPSVLLRSDTMRFKECIRVLTSQLLFSPPSPCNLELLECQRLTKEGHLGVDQPVVSPDLLLPAKELL